MSSLKIENYLERKSDDGFVGEIHDSRKCGSVSKTRYTLFDGRHYKVNCLLRKCVCGLKTDQRSLIVADMAMADFPSDGVFLTIDRQAKVKSYPLPLGKGRRRYKLELRAYSERNWTFQRSASNHS